ncbi:MAG: hypothetical protein PHV36_04425 [Elusimicrobiales bacterium]|nr:hypothetical protein [Elusimicrobiales bacterium]
MTENPGALLRLTEASLRKCLARLSGVSAGTWELLGISASQGTIEDAVKLHDFVNPAASAVYFNLGGGLPFTTIMLFDPSEMECISKCFMGYSYPRGAATTQAEEVMLLELGNIVLNSLINSAMNALKLSLMPSVPAYLEGDYRVLVNGLAPGGDVKKSFRIIGATLGLKADKRVTRSEVIALIPEDLAQQFERLPAP